MSGDEGRPDGDDSGTDPAESPSPDDLSPERVLLAGGVFISAVGTVAVGYADPAAIPNRTAVYVAVLLPGVVAVAALAAKRFG